MATISGGNSDDTLIGSNGADQIDGGAGGDTLSGGGNSDTIYGGDGNDLIHGAGDETPNPAAFTTWAVSPDALYRFDMVDGVMQQTLIGTPSAVYLDIAYGPDGQLYGVTGNGIEVIDQTTAQGTPAFSLPSGQYANALSFGPDGMMYFSADSGLMRLDPSSPGTAETVWTDTGNGYSMGDITLVGQTAYMLWADGNGTPRLMQYQLDENYNLVAAQSLGTIPGDAYGLVAGPDNTLYLTRSDGSIYQADMTQLPASGDDPVLLTAVPGSSTGTNYYGAASSYEVEPQDPDSGDSLEGGAGNDTLFGGLGDDTLRGGADDDTLHGDAGDDDLYGDEGDDLLYGGAGNDTVDGSIGEDTLYGGDGDDLMRGYNDNDTIHGDAGNDSIYGGFGDDLQYGGDGDDSMLGGADAGNDTLYGDAGNDQIFGGLGDDTAYGGTGNDQVFGDEGDDALYGDSGNDYVQGDQGNDLIYGGAGNDNLHGGAGNDTIFGDDLAPDGTATGGGGSFGLFTATSGGHPYSNWVGYYTGSSTFDASAGSTTITVIDDDSAMEDYSGGGNSPVDSGAPQVLAHDVTFQKVSGFDASGNAILTTTTYPAGTPVFAVAQSDITNLTTGDSGNAWLIQIGYGNTDQFYSYDIPVTDGDQLEWVSSNDPAVQEPIYANVSGLTYDALVQADGQQGAFSDKITGGDGEDLAYGGRGNDSLDGEAGNDSLYGGTGDDEVAGGDGNDLLEGGAGNDTLFGGAGNDRIEITEGQDQAFGDDDRDLFVVGPEAGPGLYVDGGNGGDDWDTLDLSEWGPDRLNIIYDPDLPESGTVEFLDENGTVIGQMGFDEIEEIITEKVVVPCFTPGTLIVTETGECLVEMLQPGDLVLTRDHGYQPIRWVGRRDLTAADLAAQPALCPVRIAAGALGQNGPGRDMLVSPQHRMLLADARNELLFGEREVLAPAIHLLGRPGIDRPAVAAVSYIHLLFDRHEVIRSDGAWSESFQPGLATLGGMDDAQRDELLALFPHLAQGMWLGAARRSLRAYETRALNVA